MIALLANMEILHIPTVELSELRKLSTINAELY